MKFRPALLAALACLALTPPASAQSARHSAQSAGHGALAASHGSAAAALVAAAVASVPVLVIGSGLAVSGAALHAARTGALAIGADLAAANDAPLTLTPAAPHGAPPSLD